MRYWAELARKKITSMPKKRVRIDGSTLVPYRYVVSVRKLIEELHIAGETCGRKSVLEEERELQAELDAAREQRRLSEAAVRGKLLTSGDQETLRRNDERVQDLDAKVEALRATLEQRLAEEIVDETIDVGHLVPSAWRHFYDNVETRVSHFLDSLFGPEEGG